MHLLQLLAKLTQSVRIGLLTMNRLAKDAYRRNGLSGELMLLNCG